MRTQRWQDWVMLVLGVWLFVSPFWMMAYASSAGAIAWNSYIMGALVVIFSIAALVNHKLWEEGVNVAIGIWLIAAPFVLGYFFGESLGAGWNQLFVGLLLALDALWVIGKRRMPATPTHSGLTTAH